MSFTFYIYFVKDITLVKPLFSLDQSVFSCGSVMSTKSVVEKVKLTEPQTINERFRSEGTILFTGSVIKKTSILNVSQLSLKYIPSDSYYKFGKNINILDMERIISEVKSLDDDEEKTINEFNDDMLKNNKYIANVIGTHKTQIGLSIIDYLKFPIKMPKSEEISLFKKLKMSETLNLEKWVNVQKNIVDLKKKKLETDKEFSSSDLVSFFIRSDVDSSQALECACHFIKSESYDSSKLTDQLNTYTDLSNNEINSSKEILDGLKEENVTASSVIDMLSKCLTPEQRRTYGTAKTNQQLGVSTDVDVEVDFKRNIADLSKSIYIDTIIARQLKTPTEIIETEITVVEEDEEEVEEAVVEVEEAVEEDKVEAVVETIEVEEEVEAIEEEVEEEVEEVEEAIEVEAEAIEEEVEDVKVEEEVEATEVEVEVIGDEVIVSLSEVETNAKLNEITELLRLETEKNDKLSFKNNEFQKTMKQFLETKSGQSKMKLIDENKKIEKLIEKMKIEMKIEMTKEIESEKLKSADLSKKLQEQDKILESMISPKQEIADLTLVNDQLKSKLVDLQTVKEQDNESENTQKLNEEIVNLFSKHVNLEMKSSPLEKLNQVNTSYMKLISDIKTKNKLMLSLEDNYEISKKTHEENTLLINSLRDLKILPALMDIFDVLFKSNESKLDALDKEYNKKISSSVKDRIFATEKNNTDAAISKLLTLGNGINSILN